MGRRPRKISGQTPELTPLERAFMHVIWERGDATAAEIRQALQKKHPLADTTVHTVLAKMREKGFVEPIPTVERALRFAPSVARDQVARRSLRELLDEFFEGSPRRLMVHLVQDEAVDEKEMAEIRELLKHATRKGGKRQ